MMKVRVRGDGGEVEVKRPGRVQLVWAYYLSLLPCSRVEPMKDRMISVGVVNILSVGHRLLREWNLQGLCWSLYLTPCVILSLCLTWDLKLATRIIGNHDNPHGEQIEDETSPGEENTGGRVEDAPMPPSHVIFSRGRMSYEAAFILQ